MNALTTEFDINTTAKIAGDVVLKSLRNEPEAWKGDKHGLSHVSGVRVSYLMFPLLLDAVIVRFEDEGVYLPLLTGIKVALAMRPIGLANERAREQERAGRLVSVLQSMDHSRVK